MNSITGKDNSELKAEFLRLKTAWEENTKYSSTIREIMADSSYKEMIKLGCEIIPLIREELKTSSNRRRWTLALHEIEKVDKTN